MATSHLLAADSDLLAKTQALGLAARQVVEGLRVGDHRSPYRGFSVEFVQHREYVPGDDVRHIDWKSYARTERYTVKQFEQETNFAGHLLLDASRSMAYGYGPTIKLEYAKLLAATLAHIIIRQRDGASLGVFASGWRDRLPVSAQPGHLQSVLQTLASTAPSPGIGIAPILHELAGQIRRRGLVFLISDCFDDVDSVLAGLQHLRYQGHEVILFHVLHGDEIRFPFQGHLRFTGLEMPEQLATQPHLIRPIYLRIFGEFLQKIRRACENYRIDYVLMDTTVPLQRTLTEYLIRRQSLKL